MSTDLLIGRYERADSAQERQEIAYESYKENIEHISEDSAFHPSNVLPALLIMTTRLYDLNLLILKNFNEEDAVKITSIHAAGEFLAPPPSFVES